MKKIIIGLSFLLLLLIVLFCCFYSFENFFIVTKNQSDDNISVTAEILQDDAKKDKEPYNLYITISDKEVSDNQGLIISEIKILDSMEKEINIQNSIIKFYSSADETFFYNMPLILKKDNYIVFSCEDIVLPNSFIVNIVYTDTLNETQEYKIKFKKKKRIVLDVLTV